MKKFAGLFVSTTLILGGLVFFAVPPKAHASPGTCTWTGTTSALWSVGTNWTGCGGVAPINGSSLIFPSGALNQTMSNDIAIVPVNVTFDSGGAYTVNTNMLELSGNLNVVSHTTFNTTVRFSGSSGTKELNIMNSDSSFFAITGTVDLNLTGSANFLVFTTNPSLVLPRFTGTTGLFMIQGNSDTPIEAFHSSLQGPSSFIATAGIEIARAGFDCRTTNCLGNDSNAVKVTGADAAGAYLRLNSAGLSLANPITYQDVNPLIGPSILRVSQSATLTAATSLNIVSPTAVNVEAGQTLTVSNGVTLNNALTITGSTYADSVSFNGVVTGTGALNVNTAKVVLAGNNNYSGITTVNDGGLVDVTNINGLGSTAGNTLVNTGGSLLFDNAAIQTIAAEPITLNGNGIDATYDGALIGKINDKTLPGTITLGSDTTIAANTSAKSLYLSGSVVGSGNLTITGNTGAAVGFEGSSANTYSGTTTVTNVDAMVLQKDDGVVAIPGNLYITGTPAASAALIAFNDGQISSNSNVFVTSDTNEGILALFAATQTIGSLSGNGVVDFFNSSSVLNTGANNSSTSFSGVMMGEGVVNKVGTGTFTISGTLDTLYPTFNTTSGKLIVNSDYSHSSFNVNGGILGGSGKTGATSVSAGGAFSPGNSPGCISVASLTFAHAADFNVDLAGNNPCQQYDQTTVTGAANLGNATLNISPTFTPTVGSIFTIIQAGSITGTFNGLPDGSIVTKSGIQFRVNYTATTVTLTVVNNTGSTLAGTGQSTLLFAGIAGGLLLAGALGITKGLKIRSQLQK